MSENQWDGVAVHHYLDAEPRRLAKDTPLYTV